MKVGSTSGGGGVFLVYGDDVESLYFLWVCVLFLCCWWCVLTREWICIA